MWADFVDDLPAAELANSIEKRPRLEDHAIHIIPSGDTNQEPSKQTKQIETPGEGYCSKCGRRVWWTQESHEEEAAHMTLIVPRLYVGAAWNANNAYELNQAKVATVLSMAAELSEKLFPNTFRYKHFALEDDQREFALPTFVYAAHFIHQTLRDTTTDAAILVHCAAGRSRSVAAVITYLMCAQQLTADEALRHVKWARSVAEPNRGYRRQLEALEVLFHTFGLDVTTLIADYCNSHEIYCLTDESLS
jgi:protein-tyrosine phosphatase